MPYPRSVIIGIGSGESFYQWKPTSYWITLIRSSESDFQRPWLPLPEPCTDWLREQRELKKQQCAQSIQVLQCGDPGSVAVLIELLDSDSETVRIFGVKGLRSVGKPASSAVPRLAMCLSDTEEVQEKAFQALSALGSR
jgi:hypothetical protein